MIIQVLPILHHLRQLPLTAQSMWPTLMVISMPLTRMVQKGELLGYCDSAPAIGSDGTIYYSSYYGNDGYVYAAWYPTAGLGNKWAYETYGLMDSSPAIGSDGTIYVGCDDGLYLCPGHCSRDLSVGRHQHGWEYHHHHLFQGDGRPLRQAGRVHL